MSVTDAPPIEGQTSIVEEFKKEAGEAVGPMPQQPVDNTPPPPEDLLLQGTAQLSLLDAGGKAPTGASVRLAGGKIGLVHGTAFRKGETVVFTVVAQISAVKLQDKVDSKTGIVMDCEVQHTARITDVQIVSQ